jgi:hypothetical protein
MIRGPQDSGWFGEMVIVHDDGDAQVNYMPYEDGQLWEANWPVGTHGSIVAELIAKVPAEAVHNGAEWVTDRRHTYAAYWLSY